MSEEAERDETHQLQEKKNWMRMRNEEEEEKGKIIVRES
jgi:hypothetical protein